VVESVYTADLKSAAMSGLRVRVPPALPNMMRIQVGDLVKFKHHMFDGLQPVHLVAEAWVSKDSDGYGGPGEHITLHGNHIQLEYRAKNFIVISRGRK
jgi:hypothetical protein